MEQIAHANSAYPALEYTLQALGYDRIHVATVEGFQNEKRRDASD